ncbi:MAG: hypothetical protein ACOC5T_04525 [Elusimicrobiota bacterium]
MGFHSKISQGLIKNLVKVGSANVLSLNRNLGATYAHTYRTIRFLKVLGLIKWKKVGRDRKIHLTKEGKEVGLKLLEIDELIKKAKRGV